MQWTDQVRNPNAIRSGHGAPSGDPGIKWAKYLDVDTGIWYVHTGSGNWVEDASQVTASISDGTTFTIDSLPLPTGAATEASLTSIDGHIGIVTETAPVSDIASSGLNGRLQRIAQRLTSLIALLPSSLGQKTAAGSLAVVLPSDGTLPLPSGAATSAKQDTLDTDLTGRLGEVQDSPTANTVLARLKTLATLLAGGLPAALSSVTSSLKIALMESPRSAGVATLNNRSTLGSDATLDVSPFGTVILNVSANAGSTVTFQASADGSNYINVSGHQRGSHFYTSTTTGTGIFEFNNLAGFSTFQATITVAAGAVTATAYGSSGPASDPLTQTETSPNTSILYRNAVAAADLMAAPGALTTSLVAGGSLATSAMVIKVVAGNGYGRTTSTTGTSRTPSGGNLAIRIAFAAVTNATFYDVYLSTDADPKFVGRITETQRASGIVISAQDTTSAGGTAGAVDVQVAGTGLQSATTAAQNTAYVVPATPVSCAGYQFVDFDFVVSRTGDDVALALTVVPFFLNPVETAYFMGSVTTLSFGGTSGATSANRQRLRVECRGNTGVALLVQSISGTGAAVTMYATAS